MPWITYSIALLPEFFVALITGTLLSVIFAGVFLNYFPNKITWLNISLSAFAGLSLFIILNYLLWYLLDWRVALFFISLIMLIASTYGWYQAKPRLNLEFSKFFVALAAITILLSFFLFKFTYHNGLHDEYFHYAALQLFEHTNQYPFLHPYDFEHTLNDVYHVGTYFVVILVNSLPGMNLELSLDIAKIVIFLPFPIFLGFAQKKIFDKVPLWLVAVTVLAVLLTGPSWWLQDSYTLWLTQSKELPQIYMPLLYDLAGITWSGILFWIVFTLGLVIFITTKSISKIALIPLCVILLATIIINQAYMLTSFVTLLTVLISLLFIKHFSKNKLVLFIIWSFILSLPLLILAIRNLSYLPLLDQFVRHYDDWGYHYATYLYADGIQVEYNYLAISAPVFLTTFGVAPIMIVFTAIFLNYSFYRQSKRLQLLSALFLVFALLIPMGIYLVKDDSLGLALNKLLRPAVFFVALIPIIFYQLHKKWVSYALLMLLTLGIISPVRFFVVNVGEGLQRFWVTEQPETLSTAQFLSDQQYHRFVTHDWGTAYTFSNLIPIQSFACIDCDSFDAEVVVSPRNMKFEKDNQELPTIFENNSYIIKQLQ